MLCRPAQREGSAAHSGARANGDRMASLTASPQAPCRTPQRNAGAGAMGSASRRTAMPSSSGFGAGYSFIT
jgi:hypothetical protein